MPSFWRVDALAQKAGLRLRLAEVPGSDRAWEHALQIESEIQALRSSINLDWKRPEIWSEWSQGSTERRWDIGVWMPRKGEWLALSIPTTVAPGKWMYAVALPHTMPRGQKAQGATLRAATESLLERLPHALEGRVIDILSAWLRSSGKGQEPPAARRPFPFYAFVLPGDAREVRREAGEEVRTLREASQKITRFVEQTRTVPSAMAPLFGLVADQYDNLRGRVSYNGRVWHAPPGMVMLDLSGMRDLPDTHMEITGPELDIPLVSSLPPAPTETYTQWLQAAQEQLADVDERKPHQQISRLLRDVQTAVKAGLWPAAALSWERAQQMLVKHRRFDDQDWGEGGDEDD